MEKQLLMPSIFSSCYEKMWDLNEQIISGSPDLGGIDFLGIQYAASVAELVPGSVSSFRAPV